MERYPATKETLPERLSEMYHFDRRGYVVAPDLQASILPLLDWVDEDAHAGGWVSVVRNDGGVMKGYAMTGDPCDEETIERLLALWMTVVR